MALGHKRCTCDPPRRPGVFHSGPCRRPEDDREQKNSVYIMGPCLTGEHVRCLRYGSRPKTVGEQRVECACSCHPSETDWPVEMVDAFREMPDD